MSVRTSHRGEAGAALLVAVMMLVLMGLIGLAALDTVTEDRQIAGFQNRARAAFYAAEAGIGTSKNLVRTAGERTSVPVLATTSLGDAAAYPHGAPSFSGDPDFANPVRYVRDGAPWSEGGDLRVGKQKLVQHALAGERPGADPRRRPRAARGDGEQAARVGVWRLATRWIGSGGARRTACGRTTTIWRLVSGLGMAAALVLPSAVGRAEDSELVLHGGDAERHALRRQLRVDERGGLAPGLRSDRLVRHHRLHQLFGQRQLPDVHRRAGRGPAAAGRGPSSPTLRSAATRPVGTTGTSTGTSAPPRKRSGRADSRSTRRSCSRTTAATAPVPRGSGLPRPTESTAARASPPSRTCSAT